MGPACLSLAFAVLVCLTTFDPHPNSCESFTAIDIIVLGGNLVAPTVDYKTTLILGRSFSVAHLHCQFES